MKPFFPAFFVLVASAPLAADNTAGGTKALGPEEAIKKVNEKVVVEMTVKSSKDALAKRGEIYLDSQEDFRSAKNLAVVITKTGAAALRDKGVAAPAEHFKGKTIRVSGTVTLKEDRPRIEVDDPAQIRLVKPKG
jgi:hypothetical protein